MNLSSVTFWLLYTCLLWFHPRETKRNWNHSFHVVRFKKDVPPQHQSADSFTAAQLLCEHFLEELILICFPESRSAAVLLLLASYVWLFFIIFLLKSTVKIFLETSKSNTGGKIRLIVWITSRKLQESVRISVWSLSQPLSASRRSAPVSCKVKRQLEVSCPSRSGVKVRGGEGLTGGGGGGQLLRTALIKVCLAVRTTQTCQVTEKSDRADN